MKTPISKINTTLCTLFCLSLPAVMNADVLATYAFDDAGSLAEMVTPTSFDSNLTASLISANNVTMVPQHSFTGDSDNQLAVKANTATTSLSVADALTNGTYMTFTLTPDAGQEISFTSLTFTALGGGSSVYRAFYVFSEVSGFGAGDILGSGIQEGLGTDTLNNSTATPNTITLSGASITTATEFRVYIDSSSTGRTVIFDNLVVNGTIAAIPEPSAFALVLGAASFAGLMVRRRRVSQ